MDIKILNQSTTEKLRWLAIQHQIESFDWGGAKFIAQKMLKPMTSRERVIVALKKNRVIGVCALVDKDIAEVSETPFISTVYVTPEYRNAHVGTQMIKQALKAAKKLQLKKVYAISQLKDYYEKLGFRQIRMVKDFMGREMKLYQKQL